MKHKLNRIRVCFVIFSLIGGGTERNILNLLKNIDVDKFETKLIVIKKINHYLGEYKDLFMKLEKQKKIQYLVDYPSNNLCVKIFLLIKNTTRLLLGSDLRNYKIFIGTTGYITYLYSLMLALLYKKRNILYIGNPQICELSRVSRINRKLISLINRIALKTSDSVVCHSKGLKEETRLLYNIPAEKIEVIYNGVDLTKFSKKTSIINRSNNKIIINVGRLEKRKGQKNLIYAFKRVLEYQKDIKLYIFGDGPEKKTLLTLIRRLRLMKQIKLMRFTKKLPYYLNKSMVYISCATDEGFGNSIIEALACGLPVISTDCPYGPREILAPALPIQVPFLPIKRQYLGTNGILIPNSQEAISQSIKQLFLNNHLRERYIHKSKQRSEFFSLTKMIDKYSKLFERVASRN